MDKEKQIEELGQDIYDNCPDLCENGCGGKPCYKCIAESLQRDGYRKINENEVVISEEEYERLLKEETLCEHLGNDVDVKLRYIYELEGKVAQERNETAEKILKDIMFCIDINDCNKNEMLILNLCKTLARQFGVEIKE